MAGVALAMVSGVPFLLIGLTIGYLLSSKAAVAIAQVVVFPLAFAGGLFMPPETFPTWLTPCRPALPSRAARDLVVSAVDRHARCRRLPPSRSSLAWTVVSSRLLDGLSPTAATRAAVSADLRPWSGWVPVRRSGAGAGSSSPPGPS